MIALQANVNPNDVGIIAPYAAQVKVLSKATRSLERESEKRGSFEVNTVDQYQGRDKDIVIISCTRSVNKNATESSNKEFEILQDYRRLTVAITRSKHKLIIIGDVESLEQYVPFARLFPHISEMGRTAVTDEDNGFEWDPLMEFLTPHLQRAE